jgi:hypothetical protein
LAIALAGKFLQEAELPPHQPPPHHPQPHPLDQFFSRLALIVRFLAGIVDGISGSHHLKVYQFLVGLAGGVIGLP